MTNGGAGAILNHMVKYSHSPAALDSVFAALADRTRRAIVHRLTAVDELPLAELAEPFRMSLPAVSKHVAVLERAGLVERRRVGRERRCRLRAAPLGTAASWLAPYQRFWEHQFDLLERHLDTTSTARESDAWPAPRVQPTRRSASAESSAPRRRVSTKRGRRPRK